MAAYASNDLVSAEDPCNQVRDGILEPGPGHEPLLKLLDEALPTSRFASQRLDLVKIQAHVWRGAGEPLKRKPRLKLSELTPKIRDRAPAEYLMLFSEAGHEVKADLRCHSSALKHLRSLPHGLIEDEWICNEERERLLEGGAVLEPSGQAWKGSPPSDS